MVNSPGAQTAASDSTVGQHPPVCKDSKRRPVTPSPAQPSPAQPSPARPAQAQAKARSREQGAGSREQGAAGSSKGAAGSREQGARGPSRSCAAELTICRAVPWRPRRQLPPPRAWPSHSPSKQRRPTTQTHRPPACSLLPPPSSLLPAPRAPHHRLAGLPDVTKLGGTGRDWTRLDSIRLTCLPSVLPW